MNDIGKLRMLHRRTSEDGSVYACTCPIRKDHTAMEMVIQFSPVAGIRYGFRRRCGWCGVQLRGWQLNLCRACRRAGSDAGLYLQGGGPPCMAASRWDAEADRWRR